MGLLNGDAWREWDGFGALGSDKRGIKMTKTSRGLGMDYLGRLSDVERWRIGEETAEDISRWDRGLWAGNGAKFIRQMPGQRFWLDGGEKAHVAWMKERGQWMASCPHGMDALEHMLAFARRIGADVPIRGNRIWSGGSHLGANQVSAKAAYPAQSANVVQ